MPSLRLNMALCETRGPNTRSERFKRHGASRQLQRIASTAKAEGTDAFSVTRRRNTIVC